jgi:hypothetical protein
MKDVLGWAFPDSDTLLSRSVQDFPNTSYQQPCINEALLYVKNFHLAVDVGANVGLHSVRFSKKFEEVKSFEPSSLNFECLTKNTKPFPNIEIFKKGIGATSSKDILSVPSDSTNCGAFSIVDFKDHTGDLITEEIEIITLDSLMLSPDLIKVDTQNFEMQVLMGSVTTLVKHKPVLILEVEYSKSNREILNFLSQFGYERVASFKKDKIYVCK